MTSRDGILSNGLSASWTPKSTKDSMAPKSVIASKALHSPKFTLADSESEKERSTENISTSSDAEDNLIDSLQTTGKNIFEHMNGHFKNHGIKAPNKKSDDRRKSFGFLRFLESVKDDEDQESRLKHQLTPRTQQNLGTHKLPQNEKSDGVTRRRGSHIGHGDTVSKWDILPQAFLGHRRGSHNVDTRRRRSSLFLNSSQYDGDGINAKIPEHAMKKRHSYTKHIARHSHKNRPKFKTVARVVIICGVLHKYKSGDKKNKEEDDEVSPYIKGLHFHDFEEPVDLLFDRSKFKANKSVRIPEETKRILCKRSKDRTKHEIYTANIALRNIKAIAEYPAAMQRKIAQVGQYESYEAKRILLRQGHPPSAFYFILSGQAVIMKMDDSYDYARPVRHMKKGDEFGDIALVHMSRRAATVICKEPCEFLSIGKKDFYKIFMSGGEKSIDDPDQEKFLQGVSVLDGWPLEKLKEHQDKTKFLFYKRGEVIAPETHLFDNLVIVKSGSIQILKKLKKVNAFEWKTKKPEIKFVSEKEKRDNKTKRDVFRRLILSELKIPVRNAEKDDNAMEEYPGKPKPFTHPSEMSPRDLEEQEEMLDQAPELNEHRFNRRTKGRNNSFQNIEDTYLQNQPQQNIDENGKRVGKYRKGGRILTNARRAGKERIEKRRQSQIEAEKELMGFEEENRTAKDEITDKGLKRKDPDDLTAADINPEFVHVKTLEKGQFIGVPETILDRQPNFCIVSNGADCILIDKHLYQDLAPERLKNKLRSEESPFPTDEEMQQQLQAIIDWGSFRKDAMKQTLHCLKKERELRLALAL